MKYSTLGNTDISVSRICLGTMTWGEQNSEKEACEQLDASIEAGINFIDTAEMYPVPPGEKTYGLTETYIGNWLKKRSDRDKLIIASKVSGRAAWLPYIRDGNICLDKANIEAALDASLKRLQTDYIDLYQVHWPDRATNFFGTLGYEKHNPDQDGTPIEESLAALADLVKAGKIRHIGLSNDTPWGVHTWLQTAETHGHPRVVSVQNPYNLLNRTFEIGLSEFACREQTGLLAYSPLGFGVLSGKYQGGAEPEGARLTLYKNFKRYLNAHCQQAVDQYVRLARQAGITPSQMALAFINTRPFLTSNIIGATRMSQLHENISSIDVELNDDVLAEINRIHENQPNPAP